MWSRKEGSDYKMIIGVTEFTADMDEEATGNILIQVLRDVWQRLSAGPDRRIVVTASRPSVNILCVRIEEEMESRPSSPDSTTVEEEGVVAPGENV